MDYSQKQIAHSFYAVRFFTYGIFFITDIRLNSTSQLAGVSKDNEYQMGFNIPLGAFKELCYN